MLFGGVVGIGPWDGLFGHECVLAAVGFSLESDEPAVVDGAVDEGGGHVGVAWYPAPAAELDVGGVDDAPCLVAVGDDLEEQAAAFLVDGHVAEFIDDDQPRLADGGEFVVEPVVVLGAAKAHEQVAGGEEAHRDVVQACEASDGDGEVDNVFVFFAGPNEAEGAGEKYIWPHMWYIKDGAGIDFPCDGVIVNNYACTSELMLDDNYTTYTTLASIGTFCHEYTHTFGIPDLYDTDSEGSGGYSEAMWNSIDLMDAGNHNDRGRTPPNYSAVERWYFGMGEGKPLTEGRHTLRPVQENNDYYYLTTDNESELWLFECRRAAGWDAYIGGSGLLVYHIDFSERPAGESTSASKVVTALERWSLNELNARPDHQCVDLIEPDPAARQNYQTAVKNRNYDAINTLASHAFWPFGDVNIFMGIDYARFSPGPDGHYPECRRQRHLPRFQ